MKKIFMMLFCMSLLGCADKNNLLEGDFSMIDAPEKAEITIMLKDGNFAGLAAVNRYFGNYTQNKGEIKFSVIGSTMMAGPEELMKVETQYLQNLSSIDSWTFENDRLILKNKDGLILTFEKRSDLPED